MSLTKASFSMITGAPKNVLDYGAVGDGTTDDTAALQLAFNAGGALFFPAGYTFVSSRITIATDVQISGYGATLLHKTNSAATGVGLLQMLTDNKLVIYGLKIDGNGSNQTATYANYNMVWCSIGSMELYECWIGNTKGHAIRTGNIDDFDAAYFAHDITISNCNVIQSDVTNESGDCLRIERTRGDTNLFVDNYVEGGLSGIRSQLYCKNLRFYNNEVCNSWADVGITVALGENMEVIDNTCYGHERHGIEVDAVVNCRVEGNYCHNNTLSGIQASQLGASIFANEPRWWGSIAEGYGVDYSNQTYTSPQVPNINTSYCYNKIVDNDRAVRFIGLEDDLFAYNYVSNSNGTVELSQFSLEGGSLGKTGSRIVNNTFEPSATDTSVISVNSYQFTATVAGNRLIGANNNKPLMPFAAKEMWDANRENRFLQDSSKHSVLLAPVNDSASITGFALSASTTTGAATYEFKGVPCGGGGEKFLRFVARSSAPVTVTVAVNLYLDTTFVATVVALNNYNLTTEYTDYVRRIPSSASVGNALWPQITLPDGNTIFIQEMNVYQAVGE